MTNVQVEVKEISYGKYHGYVRTVDLDEKGVYVAGIDLMRILGYDTNTKSSLTKLISDDNRYNMSIQSWGSAADPQVPQLDGQRRTTTMLSVAGINELLDRSGLPEIQELRQAIFSKVLPSIYKNGGYLDDGALQSSIGGQLYEQIQDPFKQLAREEVREANKKVKGLLNKQYNNTKGKRYFSIQALTNLVYISILGHSAPMIKYCIHDNNLKDHLNPDALLLLTNVESYATYLYNQDNFDINGFFRYLYSIEDCSPFSAKNYTKTVNAINYVRQYNFNEIQKWQAQQGTKKKVLMTFRNEWEQPNYPVLLQEPPLAYPFYSLEMFNYDMMKYHNTVNSIDDYRSSNGLYFNE